MPSNKKQIAAKHPNSRQVLSMAKKAKQKSARDKAKLGTMMKQTLLSEKLLWFQAHLPPDKVCCTKNEVTEAIELYLGRFDQEIEAIRSKHSIGSRKNQINKREDVIRMTLQREREEYNGGGLEIPDLMNESQFRLLSTWDGDLRYLSLFKIKRYSKKFLSE